METESKAFLAVQFQLCCADFSLGVFFFYGHVFCTVQYILSKRGIGVFLKKVFTNYLLNSPQQTKLQKDVLANKEEKQNGIIPNTVSELIFSLFP